MKYFIFSIDDGTIYDKDIIEIFNKYNCPATFNLNSGLGEFTWHLDEHPIYRPSLKNVKDIYKGHEIASHTLTHPHLNDLDEGQIVYEVNNDIENLENIFNEEIVSFATPFDNTCEAALQIIKNRTKIRTIRTSELDESFNLPNDLFHLKITAMNIDRAIELFEDFKSAPNNSLFVYAGHAYDFVLENKLDRLELLLKKITLESDIKVVTTKEFSYLYPVIKYKK